MGGDAFHRTPDPLSVTRQVGRSASSEPYNTGWTFQFDNDLLAGGDRDQDYTGGFVFTLSGGRTEQFRVSTRRGREALDSLIGLDRYLSGREQRKLHAVEYGVALFTPNDIRSSRPNSNDRPYASLFFLNSTEQTILPRQKLSIKSGLTFGVLGLDLAESLQRGIHRTIGSTQPQGWQHQISAGGELTLKYSLNVQKAAYQKTYGNGLSQEINWTGKADIGFTTGAGIGVNWRFGKINTPWWSFNPHQSEYLNLGSNISSGHERGIRVRERYVYAGSTWNYNAYNAFLEGQFRDSAVVADRSAVIANTAEIWGGVSVELPNALRIDAFVRSRTRELDLPDSRALSWGGLIVGRSF